MFHRFVAYVVKGEAGGGGGGGGGGTVSHITTECKKLAQKN